MKTYIVNFENQEAVPVQVEVSAETSTEAVEKAREIALADEDNDEVDFVSVHEIPTVDVNMVYTAAEAETVWGLGPSTVRAACQKGRFAPHEARKSGGTWLVTKAGMIRLYGPKPQK